MSHEAYFPVLIADRRARVWLTFSLALVLTLLAAYLTWSIQRSNERTRIEQQIARAIHAIQLRFGLCERLLQDAAAAAAPGLASVHQWKDYAAALELQSTLPEVREFGGIDVSGKSHKLLIAYSPTPPTAGETIAQHNAGPEITLRKSVDAGKPGKLGVVYARIDLYRLANLALQDSASGMHVIAIRDDKSDLKPPRFDSRTETDHGLSLQRTSARVTLAGRSRIFELASPPARQSQYLPYIVLVSGMTVAFSLLGLGLRRKAGSADSAAENLGIGNWYERVQTIARFGSYSIRIDPASNRQDDRWTAQMYALLGRAPAQGPLPSALYISQYVHPEDQDNVRRIREDTFTNCDAAFLEYRIVDANGKLKYIRDHLEYVSSAEGARIYFGLVLDVSDHQQREIERLESTAKYQEDLQQTHRELKKLTSALDAAREENQRRLAQEMHDDLGQLLAAMKIDLGDLQRHTSALDPKALQRLDSIGDLVNAMITSVRRIVADLPPKALEELGLFQALERMIDNFEKRYRIPCCLQLPWEVPRLAQTAAGAIYRIVQEALNNVARHADADQVVVGLSRVDRQLVLRVSDNGIGMPPGAVQKFGSFGLIGMRERAFALNGSMKIESMAGAGTTICITIPESTDDGAMVAVR